MQLDDCYEFPSPDTFPGAVLLKLGFGKKDDDNKCSWSKPQPTVCRACQVNIHLYQGRGLPPSDSSGFLDPYIVLRTGSGLLKTKVHQQTRDPQFHQTLSFQMDLPDDDNLKPQLFLELWDKDDYTADDFVGLLQLKLAKADKRKPEWYGLRSRAGEHIMGQLLLGIEILPLANKTTSPSALEPETQSWVLDMRVLGLRDLVTPGLNRPYAHITLHGEEVRKLPPSRRPTPTDPNYCISFEKVVQLPREPLYAPSLAVTVWDSSTFPGMPPTMLGVTSIPLERAMMAALGTPVASINYARLFRSGNPSLSPDALLRTQFGIHDSAVAVECDRERLQEEQREKQQRQEGRAALPPAIAALRALVPKDDMPEYLHGRLQLKGELETALTATPFERYPITTGSLAGGLDNALDRKFAMVGVLKCSVNLRTTTGEGQMPSPDTVPHMMEQDVRVSFRCTLG
jgi:hypothetical protein